MKVGTQQHNFLSVLFLDYCIFLTFKKISIEKKRREILVHSAFWNVPERYHSILAVVDSFRKIGKIQKDTRKTKELGGTTTPLPQYGPLTMEIY